MKGNTLFVLSIVHTKLVRFSRAKNIFYLKNALAYSVFRHCVNEPLETPSQHAYI
jgi:hypothetical protein